MVISFPFKQWEQLQLSAASLSNTGVCDSGGFVPSMAKLNTLPVNG